MTSAQFNPRQNRLLTLWIVALAGTLLTIGICWWLRSTELIRINHEFQRRTRSLVNVVQQVVMSREEALITLRELYHNSDNVTPSEFGMAASALLQRKPGITALLWMPRTSPSQRQNIETEGRNEGIKDYSIFRLVSGRHTTPPADVETFPILHVSPPGAVQLEGLDVSTLEVWPDLLAAARTAEIRFAEPPENFTRDKQSPVCLFAIAVYQNSVPPDEDRRMAALRGFIIGLLDPAVLLNRAFSRLPNQGLEVLLVERRRNQQYRSLHYIPAAGTVPAPEMPSIELVGYDQHHEIDFEFGGGHWEVWTRPTPAWIASQRTRLEYITGAFGLLFTGMLTFYLRSLFRKTDAIEKVVAQRTAALTETQAKLREDIQQRIKTENSLVASEERYRTLINQSTDAIWLIELEQPVDSDTPAETAVEIILKSARVADCNTPAAHVYGHKHPTLAVGRSLEQFAPRSRQRHTNMFTAFVQNGHTLTEHEAWDNQPGETRVFLHNLVGVLDGERLVRIWVTEREITQLRQLEQERQAVDRQQAETQRIESLGVLAGGIAHDFNNLLTSILGHASLGRAEIPPNSPIEPHFVEIENASRQAAGLCQQMLAYAGKGRFLVKPYDITKLVLDAEIQLRASVGSNCNLQFQLAGDLPPVMVDAMQVSQLLTNLVMNAAEAIGPRGGRITLSTGLVHPDQTTFDGCPYPPAESADAFVFLTIQDNGPGMDKNTLSRIFEPFFTTKFAGRGLGLPAALGIVRSHQGTLRVESKIGEGTSITIFIPVRPDQMNASQKVDTNTPWQAEGTLLVIDDELSVRGVAERMARALGFGALSAPDGTQGVDLFRLYQSGVTAALVDLSMPRVSGEETMQQLRKVSPKLPIIAMSGYNQPNTLNVAGSPPIFLPKPFNMTQFQAAVRQATSKRQAAS